VGRRPFLPRNLNQNGVQVFLNLLFGETNCCPSDAVTTESFCKPFLPSAQKLIRQIGLAPDKLVRNAEQVREILRVAGRGCIAAETIEQLLEAAKQSTGTRQAEDVIETQLHSIFDYLETVRQQIADIDQQLDERAQKLDSPLYSLGLTSPMVAAIHAETNPIGDFTRPEQYVAYAGLDPSLHDSGDTIQRRGRISKRGSPLLRHTLYLAAFVVCRRHDYFRRIHQPPQRPSESAFEPPGKVTMAGGPDSSAIGVPLGTRGVGSPLASRRLTAGGTLPMLLHMGTRAICDHWPLLFRHSASRSRLKGLGSGKPVFLHRIRRAGSCEGSEGRGE
jgi:hypothetical protein